MQKASFIAGCLLVIFVGVTANFIKVPSNVSSCAGDHIVLTCVATFSYVTWVTDLPSTSTNKTSKSLKSGANEATLSMFVPDISVSIVCEGSDGPNYTDTSPPAFVEPKGPPPDLVTLNGSCHNLSCTLWWSPVLPDILYSVVVISTKGDVVLNKTVDSNGVHFNISEHQKCEDFEAEVTQERCGATKSSHMRLFDDFSAYADTPMANSSNSTEEENSSSKDLEFISFIALPLVGVSALVYKKCSKKQPMNQAAEGGQSSGRSELLTHKWQQELPQPARQRDIVSGDTDPNNSMGQVNTLLTSSFQSTCGLHTSEDSVTPGCSNSPFPDPHSFSTLTIPGSCTIDPTGCHLDGNGNGVDETCHQSGYDDTEQEPFCLSGHPCSEGEATLAPGSFGPINPTGPMDDGTMVVSNLNDS